MEIIRRYPELVGRQMVQMSRMHHNLTSATRMLLARDKAFAGENPRELAASAEAILGMCGGAVRVVVGEWAADDTDVPSDELERRAVALARSVIAKLAVTPRIRS